MRLVLAGVLLVLMIALQQLHERFPSDLGSRAALVFGFLLLSGFLLGELCARVVPRITGYLLVGMVVGPQLLGLVDDAVVRHFRLVDDLALVLIALTAGAELKVQRLRMRVRGIASIALVQTGVVFVAMAGSLWLLRGWFPFFADLNSGQVLAVVAALGIVAAAKSPATTVAVIVETRSRGSITDTVLGVTVVKDILILILFSVLMAFAVPQFSLESAESVNLGWLLLEVVLSLVIGGAYGGLLIAYLRFVGRQMILFVVAAAFLVISLSNTFGFSPLLFAVAAGFVAGNFGRKAEDFSIWLEQASGPVFLIFFCLAGAGLNWVVVGAMWSLVLLYVGLRAVFTWLGTRLGAALGGEGRSVRRLAWTGFLGQAGVSLGLATLIRSEFGESGGAIADLIVGGVVINQVIGPVAFRWALIRSGEAGRQA